MPCCSLHDGIYVQHCLDCRPHRECIDSLHVPNSANGGCTTGHKDEQSLLDASLKWPLNVDSEFEKRWRHDCEVLETGDWGRRLRLFYHEFYGEGFEVLPGQTFRRDATERPFAGITWSGFAVLLIVC